MMYPKYCNECKHSKPEIDSAWNLRCHHPVVNSNDAWALGSAKMNGTQCTEERKGRFFVKCGMKGKLWEAK